MTMDREVLRDIIREEAKQMIMDCLVVQVRETRTAFGNDPAIEVDIYLDGSLVSSDSATIPKE